MACSYVATLLQRVAAYLSALLFLTDFDRLSRNTGFSNAWIHRTEHTLVQRNSRYLNAFILRNRKATRMNYFFSHAAGGSFFAFTVFPSLLLFRTLVDICTTVQSIFSSSSSLARQSTPHAFLCLRLHCLNKKGDFFFVRPGKEEVEPENVSFARVKSYILRTIAMPHPTLSQRLGLTGGGGALAKRRGSIPPPPGNKAQMPKSSNYKIHVSTNSTNYRRSLTPIQIAQAR